MLMSFSIDGTTNERAASSVKQKRFRRGYWPSQLLEQQGDGLQTFMNCFYASVKAVCLSTALFSKKLNDASLEINVDAASATFIYSSVDNASFLDWGLTSDCTLGKLS
jgi:hypothetical protein